MGITQISGRFYWVKRIPKRYAAVVLGDDGRPVTQVRQALHTDSVAEARVKAAQIEAARLAEWEATLAGDRHGAAQHYAAARALAEARGFAYVPLQTLATADLGDLLARLTSLAQPGGLSGPAATEAVLGRVPAVLPTILEVRDKYFSLTKTRHVKKSAEQLKRWEGKRTRAISNFLEVVAKRDPADKPIAMAVSAITREDAIKFRDWWSGKVQSGLKIDSANKDLTHLSEMLRTWAALTKTPFEDPFSGLRLEGKDESARPAFSRDWVKTRLLAEGALSGLNDEARDVFLAMINTGLRPSEITDAPVSDFVLGADVPFIRVAPNGRELKVAHTRRDIPLLGVSLEAAKRIVARGGIKRYAHKANAWSATVNKFLTTNSLKEGPAHVAYSIRHYVENALLAAAVDDRVRADILGHKYDRPKYGDGGGLDGRRAALALISLP